MIGGLFPPASCIKMILDQTKKVNYVSRYFTSFWVQPVRRTSVPHTWLMKDNKLLPVSIKAYFTDECSEERLQGIQMKLPKAKKIETVGKRISHRIIQLIDENGENQGTVHRADALRIVDEKGLKLVLLTEKTDPPVYRLMSGKQLHEERLRLKELQKLKSPNSTVQQKELTFSTAIEKHDFDTKVKQIQQWIDKKHHVKITLQEKNIANGPEKMLALFDQILDTMPGKATYLSKPVVKKEGRSKCILRHMSDKEIQEYKQMHKKEIQPESGKDNMKLETLEQ